jgi:hypothetical protein
MLAKMQNSQIFRDFERKITALYKQKYNDERHPKRVTGEIRQRFVIKPSLANILLLLSSMSNSFFPYYLLSGNFKAIMWYVFQVIILRVVGYELIHNHFMSTEVNKTC